MTVLTDAEAEPFLPPGGTVPADFVGRFPGEGLMLSVPQGTLWAEGLVCVTKWPHAYY